jgi:hypothetical protein
MTEDKFIGAMAQGRRQGIQNFQCTVAGISRSSMFHPGRNGRANLVAGNWIGQNLAYLVI